MIFHGSFCRLMTYLQHKRQLSRHPYFVDNSPLACGEPRLDVWSRVAERYGGLPVGDDIGNVSAPHRRGDVACDAAPPGGRRLHDRGRSLDRA